MVGKKSARAGPVTLHDVSKKRLERSAWRLYCRILLGSILRRGEDGVNNLQGRSP